MIPPFDPTTGELPPGEHETTWDELEQRFGTSDRRKKLLVGLRAAIDQFCAVNCPRVYIDGSFVTSRALPGDFDVCWDFDAGMDLGHLDPVLLDMRFRRASQKAKYGGEFFPAAAVADSTGRTYREFFQHDTRTNALKGIIVIPLR